MRPRRQANSIRLEAQDCQLAHQLVAQRRLNSLAELIRDLIREAAKVPQAPKVPARMADLARRLDVSVDVALAVIDELLGSLRSPTSIGSPIMPNGWGYTRAGSYQRSPRCGPTSCPSYSNMPTAR
jgi:hypothetical protein